VKYFRKEKKERKRKKRKMAGEISQLPDGEPFDWKAAPARRQRHRIALPLYRPERSVSLLIVLQLAKQ